MDTAADGVFRRHNHRYRTHLSLDKDAPNGRSVQPVDNGRIVSFLQVGGLHHRYERLAA